MYLPSYKVQKKKPSKFIRKTHGIKPEDNIDEHSLITYREKTIIRSH